MESWVARKKSKIESMDMRDDKLRRWLTEQTEALSHREVARQLGVSHTKVSRFLSGQDLAGFEFAIAIAKFYKRNPLQILSMAGLIPPIPEDNESIDEVTQIMRELTDEERKLILEAVRGIYHGLQRGAKSIDKQDNHNQPPD